MNTHYIVTNTATGYVMGDIIAIDPVSAVAKIDEAVQHPADLSNVEYISGSIPNPDSAFQVFRMPYGDLPDEYSGCESELLNQIAALATHCCYVSRIDGKR